MLFLTFLIKILTEKSHMIRNQIKCFSFPGFVEIAQQILGYQRVTRTVVRCGKFGKQI